LNYTTPITLFFKYKIAFLFYAFTGSFSDDFCSFLDAQTLESLMETILFAYTLKVTKRKVFFVKSKYFFQA